MIIVYWKMGYMSYCLMRGFIFDLLDTGLNQSEVESLAIIHWGYVIEGIIIGVSAAGAIQLINFVASICNFSREEKKIIDFLKKENVTSGENFRSTIIISNGVNLPYERIRYICARSKKIRRNAKEKESWTLKK